MRTEQKTKLTSTTIYVGTTVMAVLSTLLYAKNAIKGDIFSMALLATGAIVLHEKGKQKRLLAQMVSQCCAKSSVRATVYNSANNIYTSAAAVVKKCVEWLSC